MISSVLIENRYYMRTIQYNMLNLFSVCLHQIFFYLIYQLFYSFIHFLYLLERGRNTSCILCASWLVQPFSPSSGCALGMSDEQALWSDKALARSRSIPLRRLKLLELRPKLRFFENFRVN